ncbi:MAG: cell division protein FtsK, partial [Acidimicrobiales bacterium]|nr:cell division protein FtsK [Acidimicrobiales bacterium]
FDAGAHGPPRRPWPDPLPTQLSLADLADMADLAPAAAAPEPDDDGDVASPRSPGPAPGPFGAPGRTVAFALADWPDEQRQAPAGWTPADGNLLLVGIGGSGTTTAAAAAVLAAAGTTSPDDLHVHVLDFGAGDLQPLTGLPHCGSVIAADDLERQHRLIRHLDAELRHRRNLAAGRDPRPRILVVVDGLAGLRAALGEADPDGRFEQLVRIVADGPELGIHCVITADRAGAVPATIGGLVRQRMVFRLGDRADHGAFGIASGAVPDLPPGRALVPDGPILVQVARPAPDVASAVAALTERWRDHRTTRRPHEVRALPTSLSVPELREAGGRAHTDRHPWRLPVGLSEATLGPSHLELHEAEHALVAGPARSGRTSALRALASSIAAERRGVLVVAVAPVDSPLHHDPSVVLAVPSERCAATVSRLLAHPGPVLVLVDDAERTDDDGHGLSRLIAVRRPDVHVVAAGRAEPLRQAFAHWTREVRAARAGLLLQPDLDLDGDLLGCRLPRRAPVPLLPGRGWLVAGGAPTLVQTAHMG